MHDTHASPHARVGAPPDRPVDVPVRIGAHFRLAALLRAVLWLVPLCVFGFGANSTWQNGERGAAAFALGLAVLVAWPVCSAVRRACSRPARLTIGPTTLRIEHPGVLPGPVDVPRSAVRVACIDDTDGNVDRFSVRSDFRFAAPGEEQTSLGYLYARLSGKSGRGSVFPMLGHDRQKPNLVIGFTHPLVVEPQRGWQRFRSAGAPFGSLRQPTIALLLEVVEPDVARAAFRRWDVVRGLVERDFVIAADAVPEAGAPSALAAVDPTPAARDARYASSLRGRAVLAVGLAVGFYALAIGLGAAMLVGAVATVHQLRTTGDGPIVLGLGFAIVGGMLLWSLIPRPLKIPPEGVTVTPTGQPTLWALVRNVADAAGEEPPAELRIVAHVNAYVHETGGPRNRRVMAIGLPLLAALTERELSAVIAHELGHFKGGDTRLGLVVARTHRALNHTVQRLEARGSWLFIGTLTHAMFAGYAKFFVRSTSGMRRREEFSADRLAAEVAGSAAAGRALWRIGEAAPGFDGYWQNEMAVALDHGARPPLAQGFRTFLAQPSVAEQVAAAVRHQLANERQDPTDSHPPLRDRLAAIGVPATATPPDGSASALDLVQGIDAIELQLVAEGFGGEAVSGTRATPWEHVIERVYVPMWRERLATLAPKLATVRVGKLPLVAAQPHRLAVHLGAQDPRELADDHARAGTIWTLGIGLAVALVDAGFVLRAVPGGPVVARRGTQSLRPFEVVESMIDGKINPAAWLATTEREGLASVALGNGNEASGRLPAAKTSTFQPVA